MATIVWAVSCTTIIGSIILSIYNFRRYLKIKRLMTIPKDEDRNAHQYYATYTLRKMRDQNLFIPITDALRNESDKAPSGKISSIDITRQ